MAPEFKSIASPTDGFFAWFDAEDPATGITALDQLDLYIEAEGPFDGILAFSQGATLAATWLARAATRERRKGLSATDTRNLGGIKCAVLFSAGGVFDAESLGSGTARMLNVEDDGELIPIPTAHIWGQHDTTINAEGVMRVCRSENRQQLIHEGGHEIPSIKMPDAVMASVKMMRRVISSASY